MVLELANLKEGQKEGKKEGQTEGRTDERMEGSKDFFNLMMHLIHSIYAYMVLSIW